MGDNQHRRIDFVDLTKGVCIILVVMAHIGGAFDQLDKHSMLSCFRMPLYFFISGIFFKPYEGLYGFIIRKTNKLIIPFIFFYVSAFLLKYIVWKIAPETFHLPVSWRELLFVFHGHDLIKFNPPIWFLLALFNCNILFYLIHYLRERHLPLMFAATILTGCTGFFLGKLHIELPLYIDVAMTALPFYAAGFWIRRYNFFLFPSHRFDKTIPVFVLLALVVILLAVMVYFKEIRRADEKLSGKRDEIESELPRFVATITQELANSRDVLSMVEHYKQNAGATFAAELDILTADMRSGSYEAALTRFEARFNSPLLSDVVRGLIGVLRGDDGVHYFQMLAHDMKQLELQRLKAKAMKIPPKIRVFSFILLMCFLVTYLAIIIFQILNSLSGMF